MRDAESVITEATDGIEKDLQSEFEVRQARMYEILGRDNPYPKAKRLIRKIARCDKSSDKWRIRLIKADMDALFADLLEDADSTVSAAEVHKESSELVQSILTDQPKAVIKKEARDVVGITQKLIEQLEEKESVRIDYSAREALDYSAR